MKTIILENSVLSQRSEYISDKQGKLDLVGLIMSELGCKIPHGTRTPQQLSRAVDPISTYIRQTVVLTPTGYSLLMVTSLPPNQQVVAANKLLNPHGYNVFTPPVKSSVRPAVTNRSQVEDWLGMPIPQEFEEIFQRCLTLGMSPEKIADTICEAM